MATHTYSGSRDKQIFVEFKASLVYTASFRVARVA